MTLEGLSGEEKNSCSSALLLTAAFDDVGVYPAQVDGVNRTEREEGWNDALDEVLRIWDVLVSWRESLSEESRELVDKLLVKDVIHLSHRDGKAVIWLLMNDTFGYACADAEDVAVESLPLVARMWETHGYSGLTAFAANQRNQDPIVEHRTDEYKRALEELRRVL